MKPWVGWLIAAILVVAAFAAHLQVQRSAGGGWNLAGFADPQFDVAGLAGKVGGRRCNLGLDRDAGGTGLILDYTDIEHATILTALNIIGLGYLGGQGVGGHGIVVNSVAGDLGGVLRQRKERNARKHHAGDKAQGSLHHHPSSSSTCGVDYRCVFTT